METATLAVQLAFMFADFDLTALNPGEKSRMNAGKKKELYPTKDVIQVLIGIPIVVSVGIFCANFATSYAGL